jgi:hypothetical protein
MVMEASEGTDPARHLRRVFDDQVLTSPWDGRDGLENGGP